MSILEAALNDLKPGDELILSLRAYSNLATRINRWRRQAYRRRYFNIKNERGAVVVVLEKN